MKAIPLLICLFFAGCVSYVPKNVYVYPQEFSCDIVIPTVWDDHHPVRIFEHRMCLGDTYVDVLGKEYVFVETEDPHIFALQIQVPSP